MSKSSTHRKGSNKGKTSPVVVVPDTTKNVAIHGIDATSGNVQGRVTRPIGKIVDVVPPEQLKREIESLLNDLRACTSKNKKKGIRRALRTRGHRGGLGLRVAIVPGE